MIAVPLHNRTLREIPCERLQPIVKQICADHGFTAGEISLALVDDPTIHTLNREHLEHDYPTDVLSFLLEREAHRLEGEVIVSGDTAAREAAELGVATEDELLLYTIHGTLHLVDYDDHEEADRLIMRERERHYLLAAGIPRERAERLTQSLHHRDEKEASA